MSTTARLLAAAMLLTPLPTLADELKSVPSGANQQIDFLASINPDCSAIAIPTIRLIEGPDKGVVTTDKGRDFMTFAHGNPRHVCNRKRVQGLKVFYRSPKGFFGTDKVKVLIVSGTGSERESTYEIRVR